MARRRAGAGQELAMARGLTYKDAGVDIDLKERLIPIFKRLARPAAGAHVLGGIGGFGALVGIASNGLHSNGFSLARMVLLERGKLKLNARVDELGCTLADEMLRPTRIYVKTALELFRRFKIKGLANITGGGMPENLPRVMPSGLRAEVHRASWPVPPIFEMIAKLGRITQAEMDRT